MLPCVTQSLTNQLTHFRPRRPGPEAAIQDILVDRIPHIFPTISWTGAFVPLGAAIPDLVVVSYCPQVFALARVDRLDAQILAYLRAVGRARLQTIAQRVGTSTKRARCQLDGLISAQAVVARSSDTFFLSPVWRHILREIITIEVKVSNWQKAVEQASRNRIFTHRSFVAFPANVAARISTQPILGQLGLGLLAVSEDKTVTILRKARRRRPLVWAYYYQLATMLARSFET